MAGLPHIDVRPVGGEAEGDWYFNVVGGNGEVQATGEGYTSERDAKRGGDDLVRTCLAIASQRIDVIDD